MKKILSYFLVFSIFFSTLFNCYYFAYASGGSGGSFDNSVLYDTVYGPGNWCIDSDGKVAPAVNGVQCSESEFVEKQIANSDNSPFMKFTNFICTSSNICALPSALGNTLKAAAKVDSFTKWFNDNKDSISLANGKLQLGKSGISAWRDVFRNNCYDLGTYRLITSNMSRDYLVDECNRLGGGSSSLLEADRFVNKFKDSGYFLASSFDRYNVKHCIGVPRSSFIIWEKYSSTEDMYFYIINNGQLSQMEPSDYNLSKDGSFYYSTSNWHKLIGTYSYSYYGPPMMVFSNQLSAKRYFSILDSDQTLPVYQYHNYSPVSINIDLNTYNKTDYTKINNTIYNSINQQKNEYITNNQTITENDLQLIIEKTINQYIDTQPDTPGGTPGGGGGSGGGGDSSGGSSSGKDYTTLLEDIKQFLNVISSKIEGQTSVHLNTQQIIKDIKTLLTDYTKSVTDSFTSLFNKLDDMKKVLDDLLDGQGDSLLDKIIDFLSRTSSSLLTDFLKDLIDTFIGEEGIVDAITTPAKALASQAQSRFPTSIPWDVIAIINVMSAEPECPKIEIPFKVERLGINYMIKIDLEKADKIAELSRNMLTVTFLLFLVIQTRKLYGAMSKN